MSTAKANRCVAALAAAIAGVALARGNGIAAGLAGVVSWYAIFIQHTLDLRPREEAEMQMMRRRCEELVELDRQRFAEYQRLYDEATLRMGQANMIINGTRK